MLHLSPRPCYTRVHPFLLVYLHLRLPHVRRKRHALALLLQPRIVLAAVEAALKLGDERTNP